MMNSREDYSKAYWLITLFGICLRGAYAFYFEPYLHWDEAPQAFMAWQISQAELFPVVHFQLPYIGAVEQYGLALFLLIFDNDVFAVNIFYFSLSTLSVLLAAFLYRSLTTGLWSHFSLALFSLTPPLVLLFSLQSYSFGGLVLCETASLWLVFTYKGQDLEKLNAAILGLICGIALYNNILFLSVLLFCLWCVIVRSERKTWIIFVSFFIVAYSPMLIFNIENNLIGYQFIIAKFLGVTQDSIESVGIVKAVIGGIIGKIVGGGSGSDVQMLYYLPNLSNSFGEKLFVKAFYCTILTLFLIAILSLYCKRGKPSKIFLYRSQKVKYALYICVGIAFFSSVSHVRYMTVLIPMFPLVLSEGVEFLQKTIGTWAVGISGFILTFLLFSHFMVFTDEIHKVRNEVGEVYSILEKRNLVYGYGSYEFQSYAAFHSKGRIKISPQIGPLFLDKIPQYSQMVDRQDEVFFILPNDGSYDKNVRGQNVKYETEKTENWQVIWGLSRRLYPEDIIPVEKIGEPGGYKRWSYRENPSVLNVFRGGH